MPEKERLATYYYGLHDDIAAQVGPRYVGGYFWWYFYEDAVDAPEGAASHARCAGCESRKPKRRRKAKDTS